MSTQGHGHFLTIVSGLPRSGTSMMMKMLDAGGIPPLTDNVRQADEDNPLGYFEFEAVKQTKKDATWLEKADGKAVKMVYRLLYDLPNDRQYRVLFMRRNLAEVVKSQSVMLDRHGKGGGDLSDEQLVKMFEQQLERFYAWVRQQPNFELLDVSYNEMVKDPRPSVEAINKFLGGRLNREAMAEVVDPNLYRQRRA